MGVYDHLDSKYNMMGASSFSKLAPKRPNTIVFGAGPSKVQKMNEEEVQQAANAPDKDKNPNGFHKCKKSLPVYRHRKTLVSIVKKHDSLIVIGETGSGKTTQIPQFLFEAGLASSGCIGITQPRRVAAVSIASRVAQEQAVELGKLVGYCVRFQDITSSQTKIKYMTDGMMVREAMTDEILSDYSVVILDEAHERSVHTDVLFGVARRAQKLRKMKNLPPLKLIIMSATMDVNKFVEYFQAQVVYLEGRQYEIKAYQTVSSYENYWLPALATLFKIHREAPPNEDILVFLTGQEEIESAVAYTRETGKHLSTIVDHPPLMVFPLYSALPTRQQLEAFKPSPPGSRKVVFSTNIAETSVTIGGIRHVIDTGVVKVRTHHPMTGLDMLKVEKISKEQAKQRMGRAGREAPGKCYRTYTQEEFDKLEDTTVPEIKRCNLAGVALQLLAIGIDITTFDFMDKPPKEGVDIAVKCLEKLGAVRGSQLTTLGRTMARFPLDPRFTKVILASVEHRCLEEALTVIALLSGESVFMDSTTKRAQASKARERFASPEGDHVMLLNIFRQYQSAKLKKVWCHENFLHYRNLQYGSEVRQQLAALAERANLESASCGTNTEQLRKALLEGLHENLAELQRDGTYVTMFTKQPVSIHPSSALHGTKPAMVLFTELVATSKYFLRGVSVIEPSWLTEKNTGGPGKHN
ncbi:ATP-dependent RNA helicase DHX33 [Harpegnathos saltator]|uniref:RNA helicase n=1 Tax=Harpegnathos saltator TaxID=610380 RepID=E2B3L7_HARSA|nr:ATP-dependent RNA helicase DHX33 [Harpegnathos saltator]EFN89703.1 Putative ATP-dependent RNA helicase DHX33 [Harpegnathos saltator]